LGVVIERLNDPAPTLMLAVVNLTQIPHVAWHDSAIGAALGFDDVPVAVRCAVFDTPGASQIHDAAA
jgi:hypothetical protein